MGMGVGKFLVSGNVSGHCLYNYIIWTLSGQAQALPTAHILLATIMTYLDPVTVIGRTLAT